jgi:uncharacterized membrane protein YfbV (UPF0208 family)
MLNVCVTDVGYSSQGRVTQPREVGWVLKAMSLPFPGTWWAERHGVREFQGQLLFWDADVNDHIPDA